MELKNFESGNLIPIREDLKLETKRDPKLEQLRSGMLLAFIGKETVHYSVGTFSFWRLLYDWIWSIKTQEIILFFPNMNFSSSFSDCCRTGSNFDSTTSIIAAGASKTVKLLFFRQHFVYFRCFFTEVNVVLFLLL